VNAPSTTPTRWLAIGAFAMALGVMAGAFGAHGLRERIAADLFDVWLTGARYHVYHALGLLLVGALGVLRPDLARALNRVGNLFVAGLLLFSGSLYILAISGQRWLGAITPLGGTAWIAAWVLLGWRLWTLGGGDVADRR